MKRRVNLTIDRAHLDALAGQFPDLDYLRAQLRFGERAEVPVAELSEAHCDFLE